MPHRIFHPRWHFHKWMVANPWVFLFFTLNVVKVTLFREVLSESGHNFHYPVFHLLTTTMILGSVYLFLFSRCCKACFIVFYVIQTVYLLVNAAYFSFFDYYLTVNQAIEYLLHLGPLLEACNIPFDQGYLVYLADLPFFLILIFRRPFPLIHTHEVPFKKSKTLAEIVLLLILCVVFNGVDAATVPIEDFENNELRDMRMVRSYGLLGFTVYDYCEGNLALRRQYLRTSRRVLKFPARKQKPSVVLIQVEALDAAAVTALYHGALVMPFLNALRNHSVHYPYVLSFHAGGGSSDGDFSILNGIEPPHNRSVYFARDYFFPNSVVKVFRRNGYQAMAFHGNTGECWGRSKAFPRIGYSPFLDIKGMDLAPFGWGAPDEEVFRFVRRYLKNTNPPFFAHIITMSSHYPYTSARNYFNDPRYDSIQEAMVRDYFNSMSYVDRALQEFVRTVTPRKNTAIIIYGDHACNARGPDFLNSKYTIGRLKLEFVPLFIITPNERKYREEKCVATFLDLAPTMLALSGIGCGYSSDGKNLLEYPLVNSNIPFHGTILSRRNLMRKCAER